MSGHNYTGAVLITSAPINYLAVGKSPTLLLFHINRDLTLLGNLQGRIFYHNNKFFCSVRYNGGLDHNRGEGAYTSF